MPEQRSRHIAAMACGILGLGFIFLAVMLGYATRSFFNERAFADRVANSLRDPRVAEFAAENIADAVIAAKPDLVGVRPVLIGFTHGIVTSAPFRAAVRRSARLLHRSIMSGQSAKLVLNAQDLGSILESTVAANPKLAQKIPPQLTAAVGGLDSVRGGSLALRLMRIARRLRALTLILLVLGIGLCWASVALATERRRALVRIGITLIVFALVLAVAAQFGGGLIGLLANREASEAALAGVGGAFLTGLLAWALALGFAGLVLSAATASLLERVPLAHWAERLRDWFTGPRGMGARFTRGMIATAVGAAFLFQPMPTITIVGWCLGALLAFVGLREAFIAALHLLPNIEPRAAAARGGRAPRTHAMIAVAIIVVAVLSGIVWWMVRPNAQNEAPTGEPLTYNGLSSLGDRRLDQVVFATSHNSMAGADIPGWMFPNQDADIHQQLEDGVRGFLIDIHYGEPVGDKVKTVLDDEANAMAKYEAVLGPEGLAAGLRIRDRLGNEKAGPRDVYMCHGFCELGAVKLVPVLKQVREFLVANPGEVLIFVIQDESVTPADVQRCFAESGLEDFVYRGPAHAPWPTLREMADADQRVVVMAENNSAGVPWYHPAFEVLQETPYGFKDPAEFSNRPNRGGAGGSLLLMNHWIETTPLPKPSNAMIVNAHDALMARIKACERQRRHLVNLVAVDFYRVGDLVPVVRELNERPLPVAARRR